MPTYNDPSGVAVSTVDGMRDFSDRAADFIIYWGPKVLAAALILLAGWLIARAVKWAVAALVNKTPLGRRANAPAHFGNRAPGSVGAQVGNAAFWVILLLSFLPALSVLGLDAATGPLGRMLDQFGAFIPRLFGAGVLFFIGWVLASVAKKAVEAVVTAASAERLTSRLGMNSGVSMASLPSIAGSIVFALIIIPVSIAALEALNIRAISDPATAMLRIILDSIPRVIAAGIILALAYAIGRFASQLLTQFLAAAGFDRTVGALGLFPAPTVTISAGEPSPKSTTLTPSKAAGTVVFVAIVLFGVMEAFRQLNFAYGSQMMAEVLSLLGSVIFGAVIIAASVVIARFVARAVEASSGETGSMTASLIRVAIILLGTAIGLRFMGLADDIINLAFGLILGSVAVAAAIAFGLGGREPAGRLVAKLLGKVEAQVDAPPDTKPIAEQL